MLPASRAGESRHKLKYVELHFNIKQQQKQTFILKVVRHQHRLPRETMEYPFLEIFKTLLDTALCSLLYLTLL